MALSSEVSRLGAPVTLTATVDPGGLPAPEGMVAFRDGGVEIGAAPLQALGIELAGISAGWDHSCALTTGGRTYCWGDNRSGQIGDGTATRRPAPTLVDIPNARVVSAGGNNEWESGHSCAALVSGQVMCWGLNGSAQLGIGGPIHDGENQLSPVPVVGIDTAVSVIAGNFHSCALLASGEVRCWGANFPGRLGNGSTIASSVPVAVSGISDAVSIAAGGAHSCAALASGLVQCWGAGSYGQLGNGGTASSSLPVTVSGISDAVSVSAGDQYSCALLASGQIRCWGRGGQGRLGNGASANNSVPVTVSGITNAVSVSAGPGGYTCATLASGPVQCWGTPEGEGWSGWDETGSSVPVTVGGLTDAVMATAGGGHRCALLAAGGLRCWGPNNRGQLGTGETGGGSAVPVEVQGLNTLREAVAVLSVSDLPLGARILDAAYGGSAQHAASVAAPQSHTVLPNLTTTTLSGPTDGAFGQMLTYAVTVTSDAGTPAGTVTLRRDDETIATTTLDAAGTASIPTAALPVGSSQITAEYGGATTFTGSASAALSVTIVPAATTTTLSGPDTGLVGADLAFSATVASAAGTPAGEVSFRRDGVEFARVALSGGVAQLSAPILSAGSYQITARYLASPTHRASESAAVGVTIAPAPSMATLSGPASGLFGQQLTFAVSVAAEGSTPTGQVTLRAGPITLATASLSGGTASLSTAALPVGTTSLSVQYAGSDDHLPSVSAPVSVQIARAPVTVTLSAPEVVPMDQTIGMLVRVAAETGGHPTGTVDFFGGEVLLGTAFLLDGLGTLTVTASFLGPGAHVLSARYGGSAQHAPTASPDATVTVNSLPDAILTTTSLTGPGTALVGETLTFVARVSAEADTPGGHVSFRRGGAEFARQVLSSGRAQVSVSNFPAGRHQVSAHYLGSASHAASAAPALAVNLVQPGPDFSGGGALFSRTDACGPVPGHAAQAVTVHYSPSELGGLPSGVSIVWPEGSEHLALWGEMAPSGDDFFGGAGRSTWSRFVFYPTRPLVRVVRRSVTRPAGAGLADAQELVLRLRVQNFAAIPGCSVTLVATLRRGG